MIPKIIHYCWFGGNPKPEIIEKCIASWKRYCPDYKIIEWNESNYDVNKIPFIKEAYEAKKWAFVSDYARLDIVYNYGGFYMDTDVELFKSLDEFIKYNALLCWENSRCIATGLGFGAKKHCPVVKAMLEYYNDKHFIVNDKMVLILCPQINTQAICSVYKDLKINGSTQIIDNALFLSPKGYAELAKHLYTGTWGDKSVKSKPYKPSKVKNALRNPKIFEFISKFLGKKAVSVYTLLVFDLLDNGIIYFLKRKKSKK